MGKIDTVVGVERFAINYGPKILNDLREQHWSIVDDVHLCPNCHLEVQAEDAQQNC